MWTIKHSTSNLLFSFHHQKDDFVQTVNSSGFSAKLILAAIIFIVMLIGTLTITSAMSSNSAKETTVIELKKQIAIQKEENENLENQISGNLDQAIENKAREEHDMLYPGEQVFINTAG